MRNYSLPKSPLKETKILQDIITLYLISSLNTSQNIIFQQSSRKNRPIIITKGPKSLKLLYSKNESKHNILALVGKAKQSAQVPNVQNSYYTLNCYFTQEYNQENILWMIVP